MKTRKHEETRKPNFEAGVNDEDEGDETGLEATMPRLTKAVPLLRGLTGMQFEASRAKSRHHGNEVPWESGTANTRDDRSTGLLTSRQCKVTTILANT